jgi:Ca-activated chloride channel family protein
MTGTTFHFDQPWWLLLLVLVPLLAWMLHGFSPAAAVRFSSLEPLRQLAHVRRAGWGGGALPLALAALVFFILALARPQLGNRYDVSEASGVDIVVALDVSTSMQAEDFTLGGQRANRLDVVKDVTRRFIDGRPNDRIGIVCFAGRPYVVSPLTLDHEWLQKNLSRVRFGLVEDGTAIGSAIASGSNRLKNLVAKSKIIVLLTDGKDQPPPGVPTVAPATAAEAAAKLDIKIYTIAAGTRGLAPFPEARTRDGRVLSYRNMHVEVDEEALKQIATIGKGQFYRATDTASLEDVFKQIDQLEKTEVKLQHRVDWKDLYPWLLLAGALLLATHLFLKHTVLSTAP